MFSARSNSIFRRKGPFRVIVCSITLWSFFVSNITWAAGTPLEPTSTGSNRTVSSGSFFTLPHYLGEAKGSRKEGSKTIIHIQDAHCDYACQHAIKGIVEYINSEYGVDLALLEGGAGNYDLSVFTEIEDLALREKVADYFVKEGRINGAELFAIMNPEKITLKGLEDPEAYIANLNAYRESLKAKPKVEEILSVVTQDLDEQKKSIYSKELTELDWKREDFASERLKLNDYVKYLLSLQSEATSHENLTKLAHVLELEKDIDYRLANSERNRLIDKLTKRLSKGEIEMLVKKSALFKEDRIKPANFYAYLLDKMKVAGIDPNEEYPNVSRYKEYLGKYDSIDKYLLFREIDALEDELFETFAENKAQKELYAYSKYLELLHKLFSLSITRDEYDQYRVAKGVRPLLIIKRGLTPFDDLSVYIEQAERSYDLAFERDLAFMRSIENRLTGSPANRQTIIIVTGGFHGDNLKKLITDKGYSYISIMPKFEGNKEESPYFRLLNGEMLKEEKVIQEAISSLRGGEGAEVISNLAIRSMFSELRGEEPSEEEVSNILVGLIAELGSAEAESREPEPVLAPVRGENGNTRIVCFTYKDGEWKYTFPGRPRERESGKRSVASAVPKETSGKVRRPLSRPALAGVRPLMPLSRRAWLGIPTPGLEFLRLVIGAAFGRWATGTQRGLADTLLHGKGVSRVDDKDPLTIILECALDWPEDPLRSMGIRQHHMSDAGQEREWPELAYHLARLKSDEPHAVHVALDVIHWGLLKRPLVPRDNVIKILFLQYRKIQDEALRAHFFNAITALGMKSSEVKSELLNVFSREDGPAKVIAGGVRGYLLFLRRHKPVAYDIEIIEAVKKLLFRSDLEVVKIVLKFLHKIIESNEELFVEPIGIEIFTKDTALIERLNLLTLLEDSTTRTQAAGVLVELGLLDQIESDELRIFAERFPQEKANLELTLFDIYSRDGGLSDHIRGYQALSKEEMKELDDIIIKNGMLPHQLLIDLFEEGKQTVFIGEAILNDDIQSFRAIVKDIERLIESVKLTHVALPFPESERENLDRFISGGIPTHPWEYHPITEDKFSDFKYDEAESMELSRLLYRMLQQLNGRVEFILYGEEPAHSEGELLIDARVNKIAKIVSDIPSSRILVIGSCSDLAKENLKYPDGSTELSIAYELGQRIGEGKIACVFNSDGDALEIQFPTSFAIKIEGTPVAQIRFDSEFINTFGTAWDALIVRKYDDGEDPRFFDTPKMPEPHELLPDDSRHKPGGLLVASHSDKGGMSGNPLAFSPQDEMDGFAKRRFGRAPHVNDGPIKERDGSGGELTPVPAPNLDLSPKSASPADAATRGGKTEPSPGTPGTLLEANRSVWTRHAEFAKRKREHGINQEGSFRGSGYPKAVEEFVIAKVGGLYENQMNGIIDVGAGSDLHIVLKICATFPGISGIQALDSIPKKEVSGIRDHTHGNKIKYHQVDMSDTGLPENTAKVFVAAFSLEYAADMNKVLRELSRICEDGIGILVIHRNSGTISDSIQEQLKNDIRLRDVLVKIEINLKEDDASRSKATHSLHQLETTYRSFGRTLNDLYEANRDLLSKLGTTEEDAHTEKVLSGLKNVLAEINDDILTYTTLIKNVELLSNPKKIKNFFGRHGFNAEVTEIIDSKYSNVAHGVVIERKGLSTRNPLAAAHRLTDGPKPVEPGGAELQGEPVAVRPAMDPAYLEESMPKMYDNLKGTAYRENADYTIAVAVERDPGETSEEFENRLNRLRIGSRRLGENIKRMAGIDGDDKGHINFMFYSSEEIKDTIYVGDLPGKLEEIRKENPKEVIVACALDSYEIWNSLKGLAARIGLKVIGLNGNHTPVWWEMLVGPLTAHLADLKNDSKPDADRIEIVANALIEDFSIITRTDYARLHSDEAKKLRSPDPASLDGVFNCSLILYLPDIKSEDREATMREYRRREHRTGKAL